MGMTWHEWPFAGCCIPKPRRPEHHALRPRSLQGQLGGPGARSSHPGWSPQGWERTGWEGTELSGHLQSKRSAPGAVSPWEAPNCGHRAPSCPAPCKGGTHRCKRVLRTPPGTGASSRTGRPQQGCPGQGKWPRQTGIYRIRPSNGCLHSGFPLAAARRPRSLARRAGGLGWGKAHASAPAEDELYGHFHT